MENVSVSFEKTGRFLFFWLNPVTRTNATPNSMLRRLNRLSKIFPSGYGYCVQAKQT